MAKDENIKVFEQGMKKAKALIEQMLSQRSYAIMGEVVEAAGSERQWVGFTGNAQTSYGSSLQSKTKMMQYRSDELNAPVIRDKVSNGETVHLDDPYEGEPRSVTGSVDIRFENSSEALDYVLTLPMLAGSMIDVRFAFPVEYMNYLRQHYISGGESPLITMHQLASIAFTSMK